MKVAVDSLICEANGICEDVAPAVFHLREDDLLRIKQVRPDPEHHEAVREAVLKCPRQALRIIED